MGRCGAKLIWATAANIPIGMFPVTYVNFSGNKRSHVDASDVGSRVKRDVYPPESFTQLW